MTGSLGSGRVEFHADRSIFHFATPPAEVEQAIQLHRLRESGFETAERIPT